MEFLIFLFSTLIIGVPAWLAYKRLAPKKPRVLASASSNPSRPTQAEIAAVASRIRVEFDEPPPQPQPYIDKDNWEGNFGEVENPFPVSATLQISYVDGYGTATDRTFTVREAGATSYGGMLFGRCHMRDAIRTFRTDRIQQCVDAETGEIIQDVLGYLWNKYEQSPERTLDRLLDEHYEVLRVLLYVAKADGQMRAPERKVIAAICKVLSKDMRITDEHVKGLLGRVAIPSLQAFKVSVGKVNKLRDETLKRQVLRAAETIVATQKTVTATERDALDYMSQRFAKPE